LTGVFNCFSHLEQLLSKPWFLNYGAIKWKRRRKEVLSKDELVRP